MTSFEEDLTTRPQIQNQQLRFANTIHSLSLLLESLSPNFTPSSSNPLLLTGVFIRKFERLTEKFLDEFLGEVKQRMGEKRMDFWNDFFNQYWQNNRFLTKGERLKKNNTALQVKNLARFLFDNGN